MDRLDDSVETTNDQPDQLEPNALKQERDTNKQTQPATLPLGVGWAPGRRPVGVVVRWRRMSTAVAGCWHGARCS